MCNKLAIPLPLKNGLGCCLQREFGASRLRLNGNNPKSAISVQLNGVKLSITSNLFVIILQFTEKNWLKSQNCRSKFVAVYIQIIKLNLH